MFSYHGLPESHITKLDTSGQHCLKQSDCCQQPNETHKTCYRHHVMRTTELLVHKLGIEQNKYSIAFQSRLGRAKWLGPNTEDRSIAACEGALEEIAIRGQEVFTEAGGTKLTLIPCLNDHPTWIDTLASWCKSN